LDTAQIVRRRPEPLDDALANGPLHEKRPVRDPPPASVNSCPAALWLL